MPRDGIIDANLHINAAFYPRRIPVAEQQHTQFHITKSYTHCYARAHFYLLPPDVLALFKCFVSKAFFMVCACVIPHAAAAGCRREKLKQTGCRRKERCWMLIALPARQPRAQCLTGRSACSTSGNLFSPRPDTATLSRAPISFCAPVFQQCAPV
jgi:hypothetical protein